MTCRTCWYFRYKSDLFWVTGIVWISFALGMVFLINIWQPWQRSSLEIRSQRFAGDSSGVNKRPSRLPLNPDEMNVNTGVYSFTVVATHKPFYSNDIYTQVKSICLSPIRYGGSLCLLADDRIHHYVFRGTGQEWKTAGDAIHLCWGRKRSSSALFPCRQTCVVTTVHVCLHAWQYNHCDVTLLTLLLCFE